MHNCLLETVNCQLVWVVHSFGNLGDLTLDPPIFPEVYIAQAQWKSHYDTIFEDAAEEYFPLVTFHFSEDASLHRKE